MGQAQSDLYECGEPEDGASQPSSSHRRKADSSLAGPHARGAPQSKRSSKSPTDCGNNQKVLSKAQRREIARGDNNQTNGTRSKKSPPEASAATRAMTQLEQQHHHHQRHVRKLSNVSNRNIQLLSMKPRSERDTYAEGLRARRRSSLINLILGAPSRGPRFSEDLCSLSSHMSELCNFGIDYFPDTIQAQMSANNNGRPNFSPSIASSLCRLEDGFVNLQPGCLVTTNGSQQTWTQQGHAIPGDPAPGQNFARRRSSLSSLTSFEAGAVRSTRLYFNNDTKRHNPFDANFSSGQCIESDKLEVFDGDARAGGGDGEKPFQDNSMSAETRQRRQLDAHNDAGGTRQSGVPGATLLASVDLTRSYEEVDDDRQRLSRGDESLFELDEQYHLDSKVGPATSKRATRSRVLMETSRDSECSQDSASLSSSPSLFLSSTSTNLGASSGPATDSAAPADASNVLVADKGAQPIKLDNKGPLTGKGRINHAARRMIHRSGSELSLYSSTSGSLSHNQFYYQAYPRHIPRGSIGSVMLEAGAIKRNSAGAAARPSQKGSYIASSLHQSVNDRASTAATTTGSGSHLRETKLIIVLQVCLPFILAGFGNMGAGLVLNQIAHWEAFRNVPIFFVLLPSFVGLKGNIEMTLASRLSTLSNLNLLDTSYQRRHAFLTNLILILSQAIGLSIFAATVSVACDMAMGKLDTSNVSHILNITILVVLPAALVTAVSLVIISSIVMWFAIWLAKRLQVNPDNLSTLMAALYGDVSCVLTYGLFAQAMFSLNQQGAMAWPVGIVSLALVIWPLLWYVAYRSRETHDLALNSMPPMLAAIMVSLGSGAILSLVVDRFSRVALYQPVVNGFGANLIAVQASRVSTWLWCAALRKLSSTGPLSLRLPSVKSGAEFEFEPASKPPYGSLASFADSPGTHRLAAHADQQQIAGKHRAAAAATISLMRNLGKLPMWLVKLMKLLLWSFCNSSPNAVAARLLLVMLIPAHTLYFIVIWLVAPGQYIVLTGPFYLVYISLCITQVFVLLAICQPLMTLLMRRHLDPDIYGISLLMALADLIGTICLTGAFFLLANIGDPNAM